MKVVIAPTAFKGTLTPGEAAEAIASGIRQRYPDVEVDLVPISDGGDGFLECLEGPLAAERHSMVVRGPVHAPVAAAYGLARDGKAVVEAAQAVGMARLGPDGLDPLGASSGGLGELLAEVRQAGATRLLVGLGGSASTDAGTGMARALGYRFLDDAGQQLAEGGGSLSRLAHIEPSDFDPSWLMLSIQVACDVDNPLLGPAGTAAVYAPQKGATAAEAQRLEEGMVRLAAVSRADLGVDAAFLEHAGAAGGLGFGFATFLGGHLTEGARFVLDTVDLPGRLSGAAVLVTGEGRLDGQSLHGKAPVAAGRLARGQGVRAVALVGSQGPGWERAVGDAFDEVRVVAPGMPPPGTPDEAAKRLAAAASLIDLQTRLHRARG
ncbi:MAG: glycerate kinase [Candidatus Dormibacteria bacterium]